MSGHRANKCIFLVVMVGLLIIGCHPPAPKGKAAIGQPGTLGICTSLFRHFKTLGCGSGRRFIPSHQSSGGGFSMQVPHSVNGVPTTKSNQSDWGIPHPERNYYLHVEINVKCHLFTGVLSAN
jgi:hypothetical protein